jgi:hypothetical protein
LALSHSEARSEAGEHSADLVGSTCEGAEHLSLHHALAARDQEQRLDLTE